MIDLEQIRLLEGKITKAIDLIRVLKEENATLRRGLDSAQTRMKELEALVEGFKTDQKEIESVIVRTLKNLDDMEETASTGPAAKKAEPPRETAGAQRSAQGSPWRAAPTGRAQKAAADAHAEARTVSDGPTADQDAKKSELDIF